ncbi:N-acetylmuramoyl-L-alanine amidase [Streptomyces sp. ISL-96]|uniref:peptidoglycan recognition protein family protein n=1 Tax=Streptomyces sp. ISL-96 TaxID=2819191 RepID=UPI001BE930A7|nr:N-acetylmuramoyl-L-alanine amidase [Streptomyces sp. ISL-96]MBT2490657.1 N-acetylmuramoyl-L-alanine amidase [Streptomyces sp. ISL-96]
MAAPLSADRFLRALLDEGLDVVEVPGWRTRNRDHKGPWGPVHGVMVHHTVTQGTANTVRIVRDGYAGLPGPLCHGMIAKSGQVHLIGYGRTNHAGLGDPDVLRAVIAETALPVDDEAAVDGNRHLYGWECENAGDGEDPWPDAQLLAIERASAAVCRAHGWGARSVLGHLEWQPGKPDPRGFTMPSMRDRIAARLGHPLPTTPLPTPARPRVSLSQLIAAARSNPRMVGTPVTYAGVITVEAALVNEGLLAKRYQDGHYGSTTITAMSEWQEECGFRGRAPGQPADGIPGRTSLTRLGAKHGFDVAA